MICLPLSTIFIISSNLGTLYLLLWDKTEPWPYEIAVKSSNSVKHSLIFLVAVCLRHSSFITSAFRPTLTICFLWQRKGPFHSVKSISTNDEKMRFLPLSERKRFAYPMSTSTPAFSSLILVGPSFFYCSIDSCSTYAWLPYLYALWRFKLSNSWSNLV